jgi:hypothetical protein
MCELMATATLWRDVRPKYPRAANHKAVDTEVVPHHYRFVQLLTIQQRFASVLVLPYGDQNGSTHLPKMALLISPF